MTPLDATCDHGVASGVVPDEPAGRPLFGVTGGRGTRLLAGPPRSQGREALADHDRRLPPLDLGRWSPTELRDEIRASGLLGRGGGQFPAATKLDVAAAAAGTPIVVVNAAEGEPASRKDKTLLELRPHLVLDGAEVAAAAVGADEVVVYLHRSRGCSTASVEEAIHQRRLGRPPGVGMGVVDAPGGYVTGETSAVVSFLDGAVALPRRTGVPAAVTGVGRRPTVVNNVETVAHLALVARYGARWFREAGSPQSPGSTLVTLAGAVGVPGAVAEILGPVTIGGVLATVGGLDAPPRAVLLGGYAGTWIDGEVAWRTPIERHALRAAGASLGCGLVAVLGHDACGLAETARLLRWLAGQSAGQCGPCFLGLPALSAILDDVVAGTAGRRDLRRIRDVAASVRGRGACGHPTGSVGLLDSAIETFDPELRRHLRRQACEAAPGKGYFPLPADYRVRA